MVAIYPVSGFMRMCTLQLIQTGTGQELVCVPVRIQISHETCVISYLMNFV
jgi:hypothetical protein